MLCNNSFLVDFCGVNIAKKRRHAQRKSCRTLCLLSVSLRWKIYNIHNSKRPNIGQTTILFRYVLEHMLLLLLWLLKETRNIAITVYRRQRFIRQTSSYVWYIEILRMIRANDDDLTEVQGGDVDMRIYHLYHPDMRRINSSVNPLCVSFRTV